MARLAATVGALVVASAAAVIVAHHPGPSVLDDGAVSYNQSALALT